VAGERWIFGQTFAPSDPPRTAAIYSASIQQDLASDRLRIDYQAQVFPAGLALFARYSEIIDGKFGFVRGSDNVLGGPPAHPMQSNRWAAVRKQQRLLSPAILLRELLADPDRIERAYGTQVDGRSYNVLLVRDSVYPMRLFIDPTNGELIRLTTAENYNSGRDMALEVRYLDWRTIPGSKLRQPAIVELSFGGQTILREHRDLVRVNPSLEATTFAMPSEARAGFDQGLADRGFRNGQYHQIYSSLGLALDQVELKLEAVEIAPRVHVIRGTRNILVVEQDKGIVLVEAPLYPERSDEVVRWVKSKYPAKPITHTVVTHWHHDHVGGLRTLVAEGATIVTSDVNLDFYRRLFAAPSTIEPDALAAKPQEARFFSQSGERPLRLDDGVTPIEVHRTQTAHANDMVVVHLPEQRLLFVSDLYTPGPGIMVAQETRDMVKVIERNGLAVERLVGGHGFIVPRERLEAELKALDWSKPLPPFQPPAPPAGAVRQPSQP
jgi:glyoxylase-like metal-dependent hydrolase (beta-lactamase superfamily II)